MKHKQLGISMIELLVAMLISSFLILGVTQVYLDNRSNTLFQQSQASNIENARFSILLLEQELAKAGYKRRPDDDTEFAFPTASYPGCGEMVKGQVAKYISDTEFCIRYQPAFTGASNCDGEPIDNIANKPYEVESGAELAYARFALNNATQTLTCNGQEIAANIGDIRFNYGVNSLKDEKAISRYINIPEDNENIRVIQLSVLASSPTEVTKESASTIYEFWFDDAEPTDKKLYSLFSTSASMRNLLP
ncbi:PilW family protein [Pseudomonas sp. KB-10]|uniref:PilW family protein n=1 Tax=Pseudomonas sp. KB-10 TaxID=2292264 RepID=UPI001BAEF07A|nr:PilW family protein [Pseudomonas sp. KB-10]